jgi:hypothetical protein
MANGRNNKLTGQIGEFLVCAELGKRGLIATPFSGNVPAFDVLAADELCRTVPLQVKASTGDNWIADARHWMNIELDEATGRQHFHGPKTIANSDLIYVCVVLAPLNSSKRDRFFVLRKRDVQTAIIENYSTWMSKRDWTRPRKHNSFHCVYTVQNFERFENNWQIIEEQLQGFNSSLPLSSTEE